MHYASLSTTLIGCYSNKLREIFRHFFDLGVEIFLDVFARSYICGHNEIDCNAFAAKTTTSPNSVQILFHDLWHVVINYEGDLLHIDSAPKQICRNQQSCGTGDEFPHPM